VQLLQLRRVLPNPFAVLIFVGSVFLFHFVEGYLFRRVILRADILGALERQVFEHVRQA